MVLRFLLQNWFRNAARQKVREKVVEAAREQLSETERSESEQQQCDVAVVFALEIESGGLEDLLERVVTTRGHGFKVRHGRLKGKHLAVVVSGAGREAAQRATECLIDAHQPDWVLSAGFAGGLNADLARHDMLMVDCVVDTSGARLEIDLKVDPASLAEMPGVHLGKLLTVDSVVRTPEQKRSLGRQHDALAVDMETYAVADVCRERQVRFLAVRAINDAVDDELPPDVEKLLAQKSRPARLGAATGAIWRRPASIKDMWKLRENALLASDRLAKFIAGMIGQL